jgi:hypothetical protein
MGCYVKSVSHGRYLSHLCLSSFDIHDGGEDSDRVAVPSEPKRLLEEIQCVLVYVTFHRF